MQDLYMRVRWVCVKGKGHLEIELSCLGESRVFRTGGRSEGRDYAKFGFITIRLSLIFPYKFLRTCLSRLEPSLL